jgi:MFS family permease
VTIDGTAHSTGVTFGTLVVLMLSVFTVSIGFGVVLPLLPYLIERLKPDAGAASISRNTGLLTATYTLALFLFAPVWGRVSDRYGRRSILLVGMVGFAVSTLVFSFIENLPAVYTERFLTGVFAAAVTPVAAATIADLATTDESRARRLTMVSLAGIAGFLLGPMLGVFVARVGTGLLVSSSLAGSLAIPMAATGLLALLVALAVGFAVPDASHVSPRRSNAATAHGSAWLLFKLLLLAFIVSGDVGVFEVGMALRGKQQLGLTQYQIALMFTECSSVMIVVQALVFSPLVKPAATRWLIAPALSVLAASLLLAPRASDFTLMLAVTGAVAASAGILSPILTYWISSKAGNAHGAALGKQTAIASLGGTVGAAAGGLLFDVTALPGAPFFLMTVLTGIGVCLSLWLPRGLTSQVFRDDV